MVKLTQSLNKWLFDNHKDILPLIGEDVHRDRDQSGVLPDGGGTDNTSKGASKPCTKDRQACWMKS